MGASGVKLFDDDVAADVRSLFRELLQRGKTGAEATAFLVNDSHDMIGLEEEGVFWMALAAVQWEFGMLESSVLARALQVIDDRSDLKRWVDDSTLLRQRENALERLRKRLTSPQPKPKAVRLKKGPPNCPWREGDVFAYKLLSGKFVLMRVISVKRFGLDEQPLCELLDWLGAHIPDRATVAMLPIRRNKRYPSESAFHFPLRNKYLSRCKSLGFQLAPVFLDDGSYSLPLNFDKLELELDEHFGLSAKSLSTQSQTKD